jgi:hypothetical protein
MKGKPITVADLSRWLGMMDAETPVYLDRDAAEKSNAKGGYVVLADALTDIVEART